MYFIYKQISMTKSKRTGIVPLKKKFPPGGVGARNIALHNKIAIHALTPSFAQFNPYNPFNPFWKTENVLFDLESFSKPSLNIPVKYQYLMQAAATRWNKHIRFSDEVVDIIRKRVGAWNGIYIHEYRESTATDEMYMYGEVVSEPLTHTHNTPSELFYKFSLTINPTYVPKSSDQLLDMFTRLLGNAMGFNPSSSSSYSANWLYAGSVGVYYKQYASPGDTAINTNGGAVRGFTRRSMPTLIDAYEKYNGTLEGPPPNKIVKGVIADGIPMGRTNSFSYYYHKVPVKFSNNNEFSTNLVGNDPAAMYPQYVKLGIVNEVMSVDFHDLKAYISDLSLGFFADLYSVINNKKVFTYHKKGSNEIENVQHVRESVFGIIFNLVNGQPVKNDDPPDVDGGL